MKILPEHRDALIAALPVRERRRCRCHDTGNPCTKASCDCVHNTISGDTNAAAKNKKQTSPAAVPAKLKE